jgi:hypothetical protein
MKSGQTGTLPGNAKPTRNTRAASPGKVRRPHPRTVLFVRPPLEVVRSRGGTHMAARNARGTWARTKPSASGPGNGLARGRKSMFRARFTAIPRCRRSPGQSPIERALPVPVWRASAPGNGTSLMRNRHDVARAGSYAEAGIIPNERPPGPGRPVAGFEGFPCYNQESAPLPAHPREEPSLEGRRQSWPLRVVL